ncbi:MAG: TonB-dependent receptor [Desulfuromonadaceae bacterium]|nr:TonB-dependent receptor [Desulfuromonadaceae bacterium]MDD5107441.1 TonB-dependent receptor [Desulfuromonadaceae bacterium]
MKKRDIKRVARFLAASLTGFSLFCTPIVQGAESGQAQLAMAAPAEEDLLMFWEEKELYVQTATRSEKPIFQVAENMTVITAKDIEAMNAHSIDEVLERVPGLFVLFGTNEYLSSAQLIIQGSEPRHVTVLLDGMSVNSQSGGNGPTHFIPLRIVERIEIIRGAASSTWGSALGGIVNIITRRTGDNAMPNGMLSASYGEANSRDFAAELRGKNGPAGYYLYAGQTNSDGLVNSRDFSRSSIFGKLLLTPNRDLDITVSGGFSNPEQNNGAFPAMYVSGKGMLRDSFVNGAFEYRATPELTLRGGAHLNNYRFDQPVRFLLTYPPSPGQLRVQNIWDEQTLGANLIATWSSGFQTLTAGAEGSRADLDQTINVGPLSQSAGYPATVQVHSRMDKWGIFANDTLEFGPFAVTPGIRYDHDSITGGFVSPSLGTTWELGEHTVARASAARGFTSPSLGTIAGGGPYYAANSGLKAEYGWSYQAGIESGLADLINLKATLFRHETNNAIVRVPTTPPPLTTSINRGGATRQGYELEADTVPLYNLSLKLGHAYAHVKNDTVTSNYDNPYYDLYSWLVGVKYDDRRSLSALLTGRYIWWDFPPTMPAYPDPAYDTFIWDITATKKFRTGDSTTLDTFLTVHNIFSGNYTGSGLHPNPERWFEGGLRFKF